MKNSTQTKETAPRGNSDVEHVVMPPIGSKWYSRKYGTRHVIDKTLGGDVVYVQGRMPLFVMNYHISSCTLEEWSEYQKTAKAV